MNMYVDYLMLLSPPEAIKNEIARYKKASAKVIGQYKSVDSPAHISVLHLERQKPFMADNSLLLLQDSLTALPPVLLHIDGFKFFSHLHGRMTIYAAIRITPAVDEWFTQLKRKLKIKKNIIPHVTVVRDVTAEQFNQLWPHFRHKKLVEPFWANELTILRRETFAMNPHWEPYQTVAFKNRAAANTAEAIISRQADTELGFNNQMGLF